MRPKDVIQRFLASMGRPDATKQYLALFQAEQRERFAFVVVTASAFADCNSVVSDLGFLRGLELSPVVCVPTDALAAQLTSALPADVIATRCSASEAAEVASTGHLPLLVAGTEEERRVAIAALQSRKALYLIGTSGLQPRGHRVRSLINLRTDYADLTQESALPPEQADLLSEIRNLFAACKHTLTVSVTSAQDLLRELFTVKGAGTLVRRGTQVQRFESFAAVEEDRFATLLSSAFGKAPAAQFFERSALAIYLAADYQGAAVLQDAPLAPYLSKFAVAIRAQGEGIGGDLWRALTSDNPRFFWRSRPTNPIAPWYASKCDGLMRNELWTTYWVGLNATEIADAVDYVLSAPIDFGASH